MQSEYVQERLNSLKDIDNTLCNMLQESSQIVSALIDLKKGNDEMKPQFEKHVDVFYKNLHDVQTSLKTEMQLLQTSIGDKLLPVNNVQKKATGQDDEKLMEQIDLLKRNL